MPMCDMWHFVLLPDLRTWYAAPCGPCERSPSSAGWPHPFPPASMYPESTTDSPARLSLRQTGSPGMIYRWDKNSVKDRKIKISNFIFIFFHLLHFASNFVETLKRWLFTFWPLVLHNHGKKIYHDSEASWTESSQQHQRRYTVCVLPHALYSISSLTYTPKAFSVTALSSSPFC